MIDDTFFYLGIGFIANFQLDALGEIIAAYRKKSTSE